MLKTVIITLILLLIVLQVRFWQGAGSVVTYIDLKRAILVQEKQNQKYQQRNKSLASQLEHLKQSPLAIEEYARNQLGMVRPDEQFFQVLPPDEYGQ